MKNLTVSVCLFMLFATTASAQNYIVNVHGMVCELCSLGVAKNIRKLSFVDAAEYDDGVKVDIQNQMVFVAVRDDASLDKQALFVAIEEGGYSPVDIWQITDSGERLELQ